MKVAALKSLLRILCLSVTGGERRLKQKVPLFKRASQDPIHPTVVFASKEVVRLNQFYLESRAPREKMCWVLNRERNGIRAGPLQPRGTPV